MGVIVPALAFIGGLFTAWVVGVNNSSVFGPVNAAGAATVFRGSLVVGVASFLGAVMQGGTVANTLGRELLAGVRIDAATAAVILLTASLLIITSTTMDIPMPSAFLLVGGTIGAGLGLGGTVNPAVLSRILGVWVVIPFVGLAIGFTAAHILRELLPKSDRNVATMKILLFVLATYTAYTAGANRAGLPIGPLLDVIDVSLPVLLAFAGVGMAAGALTGAPRIIHAVSRDYSQMGPRRAVGALLAAGVIAQAATLLGVPISFNQTVIFSVIGSGLVEGRDGVGMEKVVRTVGAWVLALTVSFGTTYILARLIA